MKAETVPSHDSPSTPFKELKQPTSQRILSTREQIILLQGSKLNGCMFPIWKDPPLPQELGLADDTNQFTDPFEYRLSCEQLEVFDGWHRPEDALGLENGVVPSMDAQQIIDLVQDATSDCSVVASLCGGTARGERGHVKILSSIMYPYDRLNMRPTISSTGKYIFKMHFNGCFRKVIIDDRLPKSQTARTLHVVDRNNPGLLWPALMEKAYLKVRGGYDFPGSNSGTDISILTGWIPEQLALQSDEVVPNPFWRRIFNAYNYGDVLITLGTGKLTNYEEQELGLAGVHNYAVIDMKETSNSRQFLIKNPWSKGNIWKGHNTEELSSIISSHSDSLTTQTMAPGTFWMDLRNVLQHFDSVYLNWNPGLFTRRQDFHFTWDLQRHRSPRGSFYSNPQYLMSSSQNGTVWLLLSRHFKDDVPPSPKDETAKRKKIGYLSLYAFETDGYKVILSDGFMLRGPYVDAPNTLLRIEVSPKSSYTIVVAEQDLLDLSFNFTLSAFSRMPVNIAPAEERYKHSITANGAWTFTTAGGNASSISYGTNPQFSVVLAESSDLSLFLQTEADDLSIHVKLLWTNGKRVAHITSRDIVGDSGEYRRGCAFAEMHNVPAGTYNIICSTFEPGQMAKFSVHVRSMAECQIRPIPLVEAGRMVKRVFPALFSSGVDRLLAPIQVNRITQLRLHSRNTVYGGTFRSPLRMALEYGQGPNKAVLAISGNGDFTSGSMALETDDVHILPNMCTEQGVWLVIERVGGTGVKATEGVDIKILSDNTVNVGLWGNEVDEPVETMRR